MKLFLRILLILFSINAFSEKVYFINLKDGDELKSPFLIQFGLSGKGIAPAGTCLLYTSPSPRDVEESRMPSSA